ncbi:hypothetical protein [Sporosarcina sp. Marseille-Q4943]|uniref:hypothetical protein n=1 Tax=Sporosarcina sp. Marseille-Q4943 TaxID=2942204 RepID=UPI00208DBF0F|nr:hypothetical protein [Sporosarcina sp. Marseille-Q4943]
MKRQHVSLIKLLVIMTVALLLTGCSKTSTDIDEYLNTGTAMDAEAKDVMPVLDELPTYRDIDYRHTQKKMFLFEANSVVLVVEYDTQTYESEKGKLAEDFAISKPEATSETTDDTSRPNVEFSLNSYVFRVLEGNGYPKSFGMIGTSDEHQRIAYLYFYDSDLDKIGEPDDRNRMSRFVKSYFDYDF